MQILRLHWRSLMPWDRAPDNHLTASQRRDYLMASLGWFRDLMMLGFALLLLVVTGLLLSGSGFGLMPLGGDKSLLPMSLILIATTCMTWTLRHWTTISWRRAFKGLLISLSASWITALACIQGLTHREGVFLRTSKTGATRHRLRTALRLSRVETLLAVSLFTSAGLLVARAHPPILLIIIIAVQATVYLCAQIAALWNLRAQLVPAHTYRQRYEEQRQRVSRRRPRRFATVGFAGALLVAVVAGAVIAVFARPRDLTPVPAATFVPVNVVAPAQPQAPTGGIPAPVSKQPQKLASSPRDSRN